MGKFEKLSVTFAQPRVILLKLSRTIIFDSILALGPPQQLVAVLIAFCSPNRPKNALKFRLDGAINTIVLCQAASIMWASTSLQGFIVDAIPPWSLFLPTVCWSSIIPKCMLIDRRFVKDADQVCKASSGIQKIDTVWDLRALWCKSNWLEVKLSVCSFYLTSFLLDTLLDIYHRIAIVARFYSIVGPTISVSLSDLPGRCSRWERRTFSRAFSIWTCIFLTNCWGCQLNKYFQRIYWYQLLYCFPLNWSKSLKKKKKYKSRNP